PALGLRATDRLLELLHDLLERVTVAVVQDRHPGWGDGFLTDLLDVRLGRDPFGHHPRVSRDPAAPGAMARARASWRRSTVLGTGDEASRMAPRIASPGSAAASAVRRRAAVTAVAMSASASWTAWCCAIGLPNVVRCCA